MNDWSNSEDASTPTPRPKPGMLRLILFAFVAFVVFSKMFKGRTDADGTGVPDGRNVEVEAPLPRPTVPDPRVELPNYSEKSSEQNRALEDFEVGSEMPRKVQTNSTPRTNPSDWSIDEVETKKKKSASDNQTVFDPSGSTNDADKPKKTTKGDWSIEEVE